MLYFLNFLTIFLFLTKIALSAPTCGTILSEKNKFLLGVAINYIQKYEMKGAVNKIDLKSKQAFLTVSYGLLNNLVLDGKLGIGDIRNDRVNNAEFDYKLGWGGGYGFRFKLYDNDKNKIKLIIGAHHISIHPPEKDSDIKEYKAIIDDNQIEAFISKEYHCFFPYIGLKASRSRLLRRDNSDTSSLHSPWKLGTILGFDWEVYKNTYLNLELHTIDETSCSMGVYYKF